MRKLPVFEAVRHSISIVINNWTVGLRISWAWFALVALATVLSAILLPKQNVEYSSGVLHGSAGAGFAIFIAFIMLVLLFLFAFSSIAVNWHRYILRNEFPVGAELLRVDGLVRRYIKNSLFIVLILMIPLIILGLPLMSLLARNSTNLATTANYLVVIKFVAGIFVGVFVNRMSLKLPAIALGRRDFTFNEAMNITTSNFWPLVGFSFVVVSMFTVMNFILANANYYAFPRLGVSGEIASFVLSLAFQWFYLMFGIAAVTTLYGFFVEGRDF